MEEVVNSSPESTVPAPEQSAPVVETPQKSVDSGAQAPQSMESADREWKPNFKVKAYDAEYEIPENFRGLINKDNEKNFREVFEKAFAIDVMKGKLEKTRSENETLAKVKSEYDNISKNLNQASKFIQNNDYGSFLKLAGIDEKSLQKWMYNKLKQDELPPEQKQVYEQNNAYQQKQYELEQMVDQYRSELEGLKGQSQEFAVAKRSQELDSVLNRPEVAEVAKSFDAKFGQDGAFKNEVIQRAAFAWQQSKKDLSAEEAVQEALKVIAWNKANNTSSEGDTVIQPKAGQNKPTLPNMQGKATSPVAQQIKSIDDLKKLRAQQITIQNQS